MYYINYTESGETCIDFFSFLVFSVSLVGLGVLFLILVYIFPVREQM